jgi:small-conductance mechanosensitive channel
MKKIFLLILIFLNSILLAQSTLNDSITVKDSVTINKVNVPQKIYKYFDTITVPVFKTNNNTSNSIATEFESLNIFKFVNFWTILRIAVIILIALIINKLLDSIRKNKKIKQEYIVVSRLINILKILLWFGVIYLLLYQLFSNTTELILVFLLISIIFLGISFIDVFKNLVGGFYISLKSPFGINDNITIKEITGKVKQINWLTTIIITESGCEVHVPNAFFIYLSVKNINKGEKEKQLSFIFKFPSNIDIELIRKILFEAALSSPFTYTKQKPEVYFLESNYVEKWFEFKVNIYCIDSLFENQLKNSLNLHIYDALKSENLLNE